MGALKPRAYFRTWQVHVEQARRDWKKNRAHSRKNVLTITQKLSGEQPKRSYGYGARGKLSEKQKAC